MSDQSSARHIRVLVVDDSAFMRTALSRMIAFEPGLEVAATACSGIDALEKIALLDPDVVTLDVEMPGLDGLATLRRIMNQFPRPVIMVSSATEKDADVTFNALSAGAFDYVPKHLSASSLEVDHVRPDLLAKIRAAAQARQASLEKYSSRKPSHRVAQEALLSNSLASAVVAVGTSTGGPKALQDFLPQFPADLSVPILIVQHMPAGFTAPFAQRLDGLCRIAVREATHCAPLKAGAAYIAPAGKHMRVERPLPGAEPVICLDNHSTSSQHVPSVDVLMESVAAVYKNRAIGVILTGMGSDGARGMKAIYQEGGLTIGQDEASCTVYGMPKACAEMGVLSCTLPLAEIPARIMLATQRRRYA